MLTVLMAVSRIVVVVMVVVSGKKATVDVAVIVSTVAADFHNLGNDVNPEYRKNGKKTEESDDKCRQKARSNENCSRLKY